MHILFLYKYILVTSSTLQHNHYVSIIRNHYEYLNQTDTALYRLNNFAEKKENYKNSSFFSLYRNFVFVCAHILF